MWHLGQKISGPCWWLDVGHLWNWVGGGRAAQHGSFASVRMGCVFP